MNGNENENQNECKKRAWNGIGAGTMAAKGTIEIRIDHCKGCQLCMPACKWGCIALSAETQTNKFGYRHGTLVNDRCTACALCAMMCPDQAISVYRL